MEEGLHFRSILSSSSLVMLSEWRGVDGDWAGFIQEGHWKVAGCDL